MYNYVLCLCWPVMESLGVSDCCIYTGLTNRYLTGIIFCLNCTLDGQIILETPLNHNTHEKLDLRDPGPAIMLVYQIGLHLHFCAFIIEIDIAFFSSFHCLDTIFMYLFFSFMFY